MKWKKKTGAWRPVSLGCQFRIKLIENEYSLSVNTRATDWEHMAAWQSLERAKEAAEDLAVGVDVIVGNQDKVVTARRAHAKKVANADSEMKKFRKLIRMLLKLHTVEREYVYNQMGSNGPAIKETVDEIEKRGSWV